jgi:hypothetical protein
MNRGEGYHGTFVGLRALDTYDKSVGTESGAKRSHEEVGGMMVKTKRIGIGELQVAPSKVVGPCQAKSNCCDNAPRRICQYIFF